MKMHVTLVMRAEAEHPGEAENAARLNEQIKQHLGKGMAERSLDKHLTNDFGKAVHQIGEIFNRAEARVMRKG